MKSASYLPNFEFSKLFFQCMYLIVLRFNYFSFTLALPDCALLLQFALFKKSFKFKCSGPALIKGEESLLNATTLLTIQELIPMENYKTLFEQEKREQSAQVETNKNQ